MQAVTSNTLVTMKFLVVVLVLVLYSLSASGELTDFMWAHDEVSGVYKNENGSLGIRFISRVDFLHITTLDNVTMVYFDSFREVNKRMARSLYIRDSEYLQHQYASHSHLDRPVSNTNMSMDDAIKDLLGLAEAKLLGEASRAIGEQGLIGKETPAIMPFYTFALKVVQAIDSYSTLLDSTSNEISETTEPRDKRFFNYIISWTKGLVTGWSGCKRYKNNKECKGLCGKKCDCWWWVCGDCCYHRGCYDHDDCCERRGYSHWRCIVAPDVLFCELPFIC